MTTKITTAQTALTIRPFEISWLTVQDRTAQRIEELETLYINVVTMLVTLDLTYMQCVRTLNVCIEKNDDWSHMVAQAYITHIAVNELVFGV